MRRALGPVLLFGALAGCGGADPPRKARHDVQFPIPNRASLAQLAGVMTGGLELTVETSRFEPGANRLRFRLASLRGAPIRGAVAVYAARRPDAIARGPVRTPRDGRRPGVYTARVDLPRTGRWFVLVATNRGSDLLGAATAIRVTSR